MSTWQNTSRRGDRVVASNRRAFHEFHILETIEAGIVLTGTEIKSIRDGKATISEAYARFEGGELWLIGSHIAPYTHGNRANHEPTRPRKLLVHRRQNESERPDGFLFADGAASGLHRAAERRDDLHADLHSGRDRLSRRQLACVGEMAGRLGYRSDSGREQEGRLSIHLRRDELSIDRLRGG